ncbi:sensor histidine kinase [Enterococcus faecalis]|uniref:sensor histidine kinase n=1 Tax=Enterococcus faecalis TaxID=1351 RepID=UPI0022E1361A|nr:GHKL domain-containing protein [Enterococcus faecalis]
MVNIDTKAYLTRMLCTQILFYLSFLTLSGTSYSKKQLLLFSLCIPITFFVQLFTGFADILTGLVGYFLLKPKGKTDISLLNCLILCMLLNHMISLISSGIMILTFSDYGIKKYTYVFIQLFLKTLLLLFFVLLYKKLNVQILLKNYELKITTGFMIYLFAISLFVSYAAHYYQVFDKFILGVIGFLIVQTLFVLFIFIRISTKQKQQYEQQLKNQDLINLKRYTDQLEKEQERLAKFRHDYKNLLLSLKELSTINSDHELFEQIVHLEKYSDLYLNKTNFKYDHFHNIKNVYLKSLLIAKFHQANNQQLHCQLECSKPIDMIPMPIFDCVRVLGIILDNAMEAAIESKQRFLSFMIYQNDQQIEFLIYNSCQEISIPINQLIKKGISTKKEHQGFGLNTIQEINKKNQNMFIQYKKKDLLFITQIILVW